MITAEELRKTLDYDKESGVFRWKKSGKGITRSIAGYRRPPQGYVQIKIARINYPAHRLAWLYCHGEWPKGELDHVNRETSDNRIDNLRDATRSQNNANRCAKKVKKYSLLKGVSFYKSIGKFSSSIRVDGRLRNLGTFKTAEDAHAAYIAAATGLFGEFASAA